MAGKHEALPLPPEFEAGAVSRESPPAAQLYRRFNASGSSLENGLVRQGLTFCPDYETPTHLNEADTHYYNTQGSAAAYWASHSLPEPTKQLVQLRHDLDTWGYCLVHEALSTPQLAAMRGRVVDQAAGEQAAGVALWLNASSTGSTTQFVTTLPNKGGCFVGALEMDPAAVQGALVVEQLLSEVLGGAFLVNSFQAIIARPNAYPQALHQDANGSGPLQARFLKAALLSPRP